ncbi:hypothetical protein DSO57_1014891 [Entomophthora muscae]|uniref:Uncharacterized protein n=1 Tax=Entomophthora muscae TaxID=34485 RepID=A0ACC2SIC5_9FUNG|nr:hypothetical protein DSO57_1014891 [Entomophthora muscae]
MGPPAEFTIGMRLLIGNDRCTVRWIGVLEGDKSERLGLEWDNVSRGRHSGEFEGKLYFRPLFPKSASFIKKPSLEDPSSKVRLGIGLLQGLRERYLESDITEEFHVALESSPSVQIETRGWSKVQEKLS